MFLVDFSDFLVNAMKYFLVICVDVKVFIVVKDLLRRVNRKGLQQLIVKNCGCDLCEILFFYFYFFGEVQLNLSYHYIQGHVFLEIF